jgi:hypothetical protein
MSIVALFFGGEEMKRSSCERMDKGLKTKIFGLNLTFLCTLYLQNQNDCELYIKEFDEHKHQPTYLRLPFFLIEWSKSTAEGKWGDKLSRYWPTTNPNVKRNNFSNQTTKNKQAARFSSPPRSRHPSSSISIDGEGFGACPHPESWIWAAAEVASGAVPHNSSKQTTKNKQAARFSPRARSLHPSPSVSIDGEGIWSMPTSGKPDMGRRRSGRWGRSKPSMKNRPGKPGCQRRMAMKCHFS